MLVRRTLPHIGPFAFEYRLPSSFSQGSSSSNLPAPYVRRNASSQNQDPAYNIDLENELPSVFQFPMEIEDIGGTLVVELGIQNSKVCNFDKILMFRMVIHCEQRYYDRLHTLHFLQIHSYLFNLFHTPIAISSKLF